MARFALVALLRIRATLGVRLSKRFSDGDFVDPTQGGGSWSDSLGSPLNVRRSSQ